MKTTMKMSDLKKADGFPVDIDRGKTVIVYISKHGHPIVLYTSKFGVLKRVDLTINLTKKYDEKIYIIFP